MAPEHAPVRLRRDFRGRIASRTTVGVIVQSASPLVAHALSAAGFDWLVVDPVHSPLSQPDWLAVATAIGDAGPTPVLLRVGGPGDRSGIQQATDAGAAGILVPNVRTVADVERARRPTRFPPVGDRSLFGPLRAHQNEGLLVHMMEADERFVVAVQLEKADPASWSELLDLDFHVAVLDVPQLCVETGRYDELLAAPPGGDGTLASRLEPWLAVYREPDRELADLVGRFAELCAKHGKVAGALLGEHEAAARYQRLGMTFLGIGSDLMVMMERAAAAVRARRSDAIHRWAPRPLDCAAETARSDAFHERLHRRSPFEGTILTGPDEEAVRAVRPAPVVLIDCFREGLDTPARLARALRSLDGGGHRIVRILSADPKDGPMTAALALAIGADSVVVPVSDAAEASAVRSACSYACSRLLVVGPELPFQVAKTPAAGVELLTMPGAEGPAIFAAADFVMASTANFCRGDGLETGLANLARLRDECERHGRPFLLLDDGATPGIAVSGFEQRISPPRPVAGSDPRIGEREARLAELGRTLRGGATSIGQVVCAASPTVAAAYVAFGVDWVWIEWQHSSQDAETVRAQVAAVAQRGGLSIARTAGAHDKAGIQQCLDAGVDVVLVPYVNSVEEANEAIRHCLFPPRGDRVWNGRELSRSKRTALMFQLETSACMDALQEICRLPEMDFGFVGPGDLAMSMGLATRDSMLGFLAAPELAWCLRHVAETCTAAGKIVGGFTRGGDPSTLLSQGFSMVALSHDLLDVTAGAQSIMTGAVRVGGVAVATAPGLTRLRNWSRRASRSIPTLGFLCTTMLPAVVRHLWAVKGWRRSPNLVLPKAMPAQARAPERRGRS